MTVVAARRYPPRLAPDALSHHPHIGTRTSDPIIRRMTVLACPYLIFYETTDQEIIFQAIRHSARDPSDMPGVGN
jgi:toxin ParE1/3/4